MARRGAACSVATTVKATDDARSEPQCSCSSRSATRSGCRRRRFDLLDLERSSRARRSGKEEMDARRDVARVCADRREDHARSVLPRGNPEAGFSRWRVPRMRARRPRSRHRAQPPITRDPTNTRGSRRTAARISFLSSGLRACVGTTELAKALADLPLRIAKRRSFGRHERNPPRTHTVRAQRGDAGYVSTPKAASSGGGARATRTAWCARRDRGRRTPTCARARRASTRAVSPTRAGAHQ